MTWLKSAPSAAYLRSKQRSAQFDQLHWVRNVESHLLPENDAISDNDVLSLDLASGFPINHPFYVGPWQNQ